MAVGGGNDPARQIGWTGADRTAGLTRPPPEGKSAPITDHSLSRTSEIRQMPISVRPSIEPAEIGGSPAHGAHDAHGAHRAFGVLGTPGAPAAGAAPAPAARRHGA
ncbi:hypothetical protein Snoj_38040 [Streptomyces nojiriensis]|uniref:Uncharacterized protein n=1 Tax=Streptomyces nojiriensis TaxID=66374 RepID=A0ABQ3SP44_9ACTN|nr:hypothetical protein GCM10010205_48410 [Streptomyces nojiriensis]GHI69886.1 hypothetical protein Snoj_38040 [Streptomyces nojiriensis]